MDVDPQIFKVQALSLLTTSLLRALLAQCFPVLSTSPSSFYVCGKTTDNGEVRETPPPRFSTLDTKYSTLERNAAADPRTKCGCHG